MSTPTPSSERDAQLLSVGKQCSAPSCLLIDFLPFKCQHCSKPYCAEHFTVEGHKCDQYDEHKHNRVAPSCPFCNEPVAIRVDEDPNMRMERHIEQECSVLTGRVKQKSGPICANKKCSKVLFAPIRCDKCRQQFCPAHRFPSDHTCAGATSTKPATAPSTAANLNTKVSTASGVMKQKLAATANQAKTAVATAATKPSTSTTQPSQSTSKSIPSLPGPFNKTDRRAKAERESRRKAMAERAKKGLLSEEEKAIFAKEEAERAKEKDKDCVVM